MLYEYLCWNIMTQSNIKFNESVFDYETLSFWSYEKPGWENVVIMSILFSNFFKIFLETYHSYLGKK